MLVVGVFVGVGVCVSVCAVWDAFVFAFNRGHTLAYFHTNEDTHETEDCSRFLDRCNRSKTA